MNTKKSEHSNQVDDYIDKFSDEIKPRLLIMRELIKKTAPEATESISYGLVGYKYRNKPLVYFGGFSHHIGFYATPNGHEKFKKDFARYKQGKGSVQLPLKEPLPLDLVKRVIEYRLSTLQHEDGDAV